MSLGHFSTPSSSSLWSSLLSSVLASTIVRFIYEFIVDLRRWPWLSFLPLQALNFSLFQSCSQHPSKIPLLCFGVNWRRQNITTASIATNVTIMIDNKTIIMLKLLVCRVSGLLNSSIRLTVNGVILHDFLVFYGLHFGSVYQSNRISLRVVEVIYTWRLRVKNVRILDNEVRLIWIPGSKSVGL